MVIIVWSQNKSKKAHLRSGTLWFKGVKYIYAGVPGEKP